MGGLLLFRPRTPLDLLSQTRGIPPLPPFVIHSLLLAAFACDARAQDWKEVYDPMVVRSLYLQVDPTDWSRVINDQPQEGQTESRERADAMFNG